MTTSNTCNDADPSNHEVMRKFLKPDPTNDQIIQAISTTYQCDQSHITILKELESYDDRNYLIQLDSKKYLCKVYNGVESSEYIKSSSISAEQEHFPLSCLHLYSFIWNHLNLPQYPVRTSAPLPIPDHDKQTHVAIHVLPVISQDHSPRPIALQLLEWVEGTTMASSQALPIETLLEAGKYLGNVCKALDDLTEMNEMARRAADRYHAWDGKHTLDLQKFVGCIQNEKRRALVQSVLDSFRKELVDSPDKPDFRVGILQGDFNDANIILNDKGNISGVIDFGDTTLSWRILDLSMAMAYAMISSYGKKNRSISAAAAMLRGFHSVYPLTSDERKHLRLLVACRLSCSVTIGAYSYQLNPQNEYLLLHAQPAWNTLELLWGSSSNNHQKITAAIENIFRVACDGCSTDIADLSFPDPSIVDTLQIARCVDVIEPPPEKRQKIDADASVEKLSITFVTGNKKKLEEVQRILSSSSNSTPDDFPFSICNKKVDLPELQGDDPLEIAREKAALAAKEMGGPVITEDTSLCFTALHGMPGPYIKWFLEKCGHEGLNDMIQFSQDKSGYAQTVVGFCAGPGKEVIVFDGRTTGQIVPPRGSLDFGWDPIFQPDEGNCKTYAEMSKAEKDAISHRSRAFGKLKTYLETETQKIKLEIER
mmetsp:Transcript_15828/g.29863  ORF Transcript_15828/g.29863 Transcript_15828/m.29863 type:complete len:653 (+) Transcript_15828:82-2040(+)